MKRKDDWIKGEAYSMKKWIPAAATAQVLI